MTFVWKFDWTDLIAINIGDDNRFPTKFTELKILIKC